jgi:hypothetical protein
MYSTSNNFLKNKTALNIILRQDSKMIWRSLKFELSYYPLFHSIRIPPGILSYSTHLRTFWGKYAIYNTTDIFVNTIGFLMLLLASKIKQRLCRAWEWHRNIWVWLIYVLNKLWQVAQQVLKHSLNYAISYNSALRSYYIKCFVINLT